MFGLSRRISSLSVGYSSRRKVSESESTINFEGTNTKLDDERRACDKAQSIISTLSKDITQGIAAGVTNSSPMLYIRSGVACLTECIVRGTSNLYITATVSQWMVLIATKNGLAIGECT